MVKMLRGAPPSQGAAINTTHVGGLTPSRCGSGHPPTGKEVLLTRLQVTGGGVDVVSLWSLTLIGELTCWGFGHSL